MSGGLAWLDGRLVPREQATISIDDFAVRYGAACFETMLAQTGTVFRLRRHLERLEGGLRLMGVEPPAREVLAEAVHDTLRANDLAEAVVRLTVTAGSGPGPDLGAASGPSVFVTADPVPPPPAPARLAVASVRLDEERPWRPAKVAQFLPYLLARREARLAGADDALLLNHRGEIVESATANIFLVMDQALVTPSLECGPLPGIAREAVLEVAQAEGIRVAEGEFSVEALMGASAAFLTSSLGLHAVTAIEARDAEGRVAVDWAASDLDHPIFGRIWRAYADLVRAECAATP